jgi:hypothetical protein
MEGTVAKKKAKSKSKPKSKVAKRRPVASNQPLPGMEQVRSAGLSRICAAIAETRAEKNRAVETDKGLLGNALDVMRREERTAYTDHGVELLLTHIDKIRARLVDDSRSSDDSQGDLGDIEG